MPFHGEGGGSEEVAGGQIGNLAEWHPEDGLLYHVFPLIRCNNKQNYPVKGSD